MTDFLVEIGCEELPPNSLLQLANAFAQGLKAGLKTATLQHGEIQTYATPRRLAVLIKALINKQPDQVIERRGPAWDAAFDETGKPTKSTIGFAKSCGVQVGELEKIENPKGSWLFYKQKKFGAKTTEVISDIVTKALKTLPIPRAMRWNNNDFAFVRPMHWLLMLYGNKIINCKIFGIKSSKETYGHRFHYPKKIIINSPKEYSSALNNPGFVIADFAKRKSIIHKQIEKISKPYGKALIEKLLLNEVTGLVEWPVALLGTFKAHFLKLPKEVLILSMQKQQKCFPVVDQKNKLLPYFITICNIKSKKPKQVIKGYERVINARLTDAEFFYHKDLKQPLENNIEKLKNIVFQTKLGSLYDKTLRLEKLSAYIATQINIDPKPAKHAAKLAKTDLVTEMVKEFPELQGIMGSYYAKLGDLKEQYMPRFAGDKLPQSKVGQVLAIADRIDTIVGIFAINQIPTGDKDPYGLRRAALGILRIIIEKKLNLDLKNLLAQAIRNYKFKIDQKPILDFLFERLHFWYLEKGVSPHVFAAVLARFPTEPLDFARRVQAVTKFQKLPEAEFLAIANKRVSNIIKKARATGQMKKVGATSRSPLLLIERAEQELMQKISAQEKLVIPLYEQRQYTRALTILAKLKNPIDKFFDTVMVMTDDEKLRNNRLALLNRLRNLFLYVADISLLQS